MTVHEDQPRETVKARPGVPAGAASCHAALIGGYVIEGHVPAEDIRRLPAEHPDALGLAAPGMAMGSPGIVRTMEIDTKAGGRQAMPRSAPDRAAPARTTHSGAATVSRKASGGMLLLSFLALALGLGLGGVVSG